jgi:hypothetical protein
LKLPPKRKTNHAIGDCPPKKWLPEENREPEPANPSRREIIGGRRMLDYSHPLQAALCGSVHNVYEMAKNRCITTSDKKFG